MLFAAALACAGQELPSVPVKAPKGARAPVVHEAPAQNSTALRAEALESPVSGVTLSFVAPELAERVLLAEPRDYRVRLISDGAPDVTEIELGLDSGRPRRLPLSQLTITLAELISDDVPLRPGSHWLFAAPVLASGLVPRAASGAPRIARARRFFVGKAADEAGVASGAVWLRRPEGSYNGPKNSESVIFEAFAFSALGAPTEEPCTIALRSPEVSGQLRFASAFLVHDLPSGVYEVSTSAPAAPTSNTQFNVNRELGGTP